jgi:N6-L-threonylcarbamoyladenine synthase
MKILAIETSCDETAAAVVEDGTRILSNVVASQIDIHRRYGGIVPEVASRQHVLSMVPVYEEALRVAETSLDAIDRIAVTYGPDWRARSWYVNFAKALAFSRGIPFYGVNHMEAHVYANWLAFRRTATTRHASRLVSHRLRWPYGDASDDRPRPLPFAGPDP